MKTGRKRRTAAGVAALLLILPGVGGCVYVDKFQAQRVLVNAQVLADDYHPRTFEDSTDPSTGRVWGTSVTDVAPKPGQAQPTDSVVVVPLYYHCEKGGFYEILGVRRIDCKTGYVSYPARHCMDIIFFSLHFGFWGPFASYYIAGSDVRALAWVFAKDCWPVLVHNWTGPGASSLRLKQRWYSPPRGADGLIEARFFRRTRAFDREVADNTVADLDRFLKRGLDEFCRSVDESQNLMPDDRPMIYRQLCDYLRGAAGYEPWRHRREVYIRAAEALEKIQQKHPTTASTRPAKGS